MSISTCIICSKQISISKNNYVISQCNHLFHLNCLLSINKFSNKCPSCDTYLLEPNYLDNVKYEWIDILNLIDIIISNLKECILKEKMIKIKSILNYNLENNIKDNIEIFIDNLVEICYTYDNGYEIDMILNELLL